MNGIEPRLAPQVQAATAFSIEAANAQDSPEPGVSHEVQASNAEASNAVDPVTPRDEDDEPTQIEIAEVARDVLEAAVASQDALDAATEMPSVVNWLLNDASKIQPSHVDRLLVGFLKQAITSGRDDLIEPYVNTLVSSPTLRLDPGRRLALLMGRALPVSPATWKPEAAMRAGEHFPIANAAAADLAEARAVTARPYHGPPLLNRMSREVPFRSFGDAVPESQIAICHGTRALSTGVIESNELTFPELKEFFASVYPGRLNPVPAGPNRMHTAAEFAMAHGHIGMVVGMTEAIMTSNLPMKLKTDLYAALRVDLNKLVEELLVVAKLPDQDWAEVVLSGPALPAPCEPATQGDELTTDSPVTPCGPESGSAAGPSPI